MDSIGEKINYYRVQRGYSNKSLSNVTGIARSYIVELEGAKYLNPSLEIICKICKALGVTPNDLISEKMYQ